MAAWVMIERFALAAAMVVLTGCGADASGDTPATIDVKLGGKAFTLEVAVTDEQIRRGLMGRDHLAENAGMIFVFPDQRERHFWMKDCLIDLDVIYFDSSGRIVKIHTMRHPRTEQENAKPPPYPSEYPARFAIELNAGMADKLALRHGQEAGLPVDRIKRLAE